MEKTFVMIKPDAYETGNDEKIFKSIMRKVSKEDTLTVYKVQEILCNEKFIQEHYKEHKNKEFYTELLSYFKDETIYGFVIVGDGAVEIMRDYVANRLRPKYAKNLYENAIHASDSIESGEYEANNFLNLIK